MKRKVVKHGPSTFIVSLPLKWVRKYGIERGDELEVREKGKKLIINPEMTRERLKISKDVSTLLPRLVDRFLARAYQKGYDEIRLIHNDIELLETIKRKVHELIGYEIIEQNSKDCLIKSITSNIELDFHNSLRKSFLLIKEMLNLLEESYVNEDSESLKNLYLNDLEVNRLCYFCLRWMNKESNLDTESNNQTNILYYLVENLEDLGDCIKDLAGLLAGNQKNEEILKILRMIKEHFEISYSFFYAPDIKKANDAYELYQKTKAEINQLLNEGMENHQTISLMNLKDASHIIYHFTTMRLDFIK